MIVSGREIGVSHKTHSGELVPADYIFWKNFFADSTFMVLLRHDLLLSHPDHTAAEPNKTPGVSLASAAQSCLPPSPGARWQDMETISSAQPTCVFANRAVLGC